MINRRFVAALSLIALVGVLQTVMVVAFGQSAAGRFATNGVYIGVGVFAVIGGIASVRRMSGRESWAWGSLALLSCCNLTAAIYTPTLFDSSIAKVGGRMLAISSVSPSDIAQGISLPCGLAAGALLLAAPLRVTRFRTAIDILIGGTTVFFSLWVLFLQRLAENSPYNGTSLVTFSAPLTADGLFVVAITMRLLWSAPAERPALYTISFAAVAAAIGNAMLVSARLTPPFAVTSDAFEIPYAIAVLSMGLGGALAAPEPPTPPAEYQQHGFRSAAVPQVLLILGACAATLSLLHGGHPDVVAMIDVAGIMALAGVRQAFELRENRMLTGGLQQRTRELQVSEERFRGLVQNSSDVIFILNGDGAITYVSASVDPVLDLKPGPLVGVPFDSLAQESDRPSITAHLEALRKRESVALALRFSLRTSEGHARIVEAVPSNHFDDGAISGLVVNLRDITERAELEEQLRHQALHDALTNLANRVLFRDRLEHSLQRCRRTSERVAVLYIDLDNFKDVNDSMGHETGDRLLCTIASRIRGATRDADTAARLGGDEFALLIEGGVDDRSVLTAAERVLGAVAQPVTMAERLFTPSASIGIALASWDDAGDDVLRRADVAMYQAKAAGKGIVALFEEGMDKAAGERLHFRAEMHAALLHHDIVVHYQPIVMLRDGAISGFEALARWQHSDRGLVPPAEFIHLAEETGQIVDIGRYVLIQACRDVQQWREESGDRELSVSVDISARHLDRGALCDDVKAALLDSHLPATSLIIELTESTILTSMSNSKRQVDQLRELGVRLALDGFGTGHSSLGHLRELPIDILKIDRSFILELTSESQAAQFVQAIATLARALRICTVAEGVEEYEQVAALQRLSVDEAQGFLLGRPLMGDDARALLLLGPIPLDPVPHHPSGTRAEAGNRSRLKRNPAQD